MAGVNYLIFGNSIVAGVGVSNINDSFPRVLANMLGVTVNINAQPGENLQKLFGTNSLTNLLFEPTPEQLANQPVPDTFDSSFYKKWIIEVVINDARLNGQDEYNNNTTFKAAYIRILNEFNLRGCPDSCIVMANCGIYLNADQETNDRITAFNGVINEIKIERPNIQVIDIHSELMSLPEPKSQYFSDGLHPNEQGAQIIANFYYDELTTPIPIKMMVKHGNFII